MSSAATPEAVATAAVLHARVLLGARSATVFEVEGDDLAMLVRDGAEEDVGRWARVPLSATAPVTDAVRGRSPVWLGGPGEWRRRYPALADEARRRGIVAAASLPLVVGETAVGAMALVFARRHRFDASDRDTARVLAETCGQALVRARLQRAAEREREAAELLAEVSFALDATSGVDERLERLVELLVPRVADLVTVRLAAHGDAPSVLAAVAHADPGKAALARRLYSRHTAPAHRPGPARVIATGEPELISEATDEMARSYVADHDFADNVRGFGIRSYMSLPLRARGVVLGALTLMTTSDSGRRYAPADQALAGEIARRAALAIDNARRYEAEQAARAAAERARGRTERLQRVTAALSAALTQEDVALVVVGEAMEALAAAAGAVVVLEEGGARVVVASGYPEDVLRTGGPVDLDADTPLASILRDGRELWLEGADEWTRRFVAPRAAGLGAAGVGLPLRAGGRLVGALALRFGEDVRRFPPGDRALVLAMAGQCAQALERARLYEAERHEAEVLQQALLPADLPPMAAAQVRVRYLPAGGGRSGGDFYDAVELADGRLSVVVGDVVGHGTEAAAVMGQLRSAWRAFALEGTGPAALVRRLSRFAESVPGASVATVACGILDGRVLRYVCAGHPPPLLRGLDGRARFLDDGRGPPLAVGTDHYREGRVLLEPGAFLLFYTDGVVEHDRDADRGMAELAALVEDARGEPSELLGRLAERIGPRPADDCALLALRVSAHVAPLTLDVPADPAALRPARLSVRRWLVDAGVSGLAAEDILLATGEALANGVEHAYAGRPEAGRHTVWLELRREDGYVVIGVRDGGSWRPPHAVPGSRGRGLPMMRALMDEVEIRREQSGTTIRMRRGVEAPSPVRAAASPPDGAPDRSAAVPSAGAVQLGDEIDAATAPATGRALRALARERGGHLVLDLRQIAFLGSSGVRMLVELSSALADDGGRLEVVAAPGTLARRVLDLTGTSELLAVRDRAPG